MGSHLQVVVRVPIAVKYDDRVCRRQIDAKPPGPRAQEKDGKVVLLVVELVDGVLPR